jgi:PTS system nitrogen regulatory IIA component
MGSEMMDLDQLADYLQRDVREVSKLANRGHLPGQKISGQWRFARTEINHWLENQLHDLSEQQLSALENRSGESEQELLVTTLLSEACMAVPLPAGTKASVLKELVNLAEQSWQVYDPEVILAALRQREEVSSTAMPLGVALPHPHRPLPAALGESVLAYGRTASGVPFGGKGLTDIFFLVCCREDRTHLRVLARLARMLQRPGLVDELREAETPADTWQLLLAAEQELVADL